MGSRLAGSLGLSYLTTTWGMALTYTLILEGVGCLCWTVVLRPDATTPRVVASGASAYSEIALPAPRIAVTHAIPERNDQEPVADAGSQKAAGEFPEDQAPRERQFRDDVARVVTALSDSNIQPTVALVRHLLRRSQRHAHAVRKAVEESLGRQSHETASSMPSESKQNERSRI